jgi:hypothetical protein
MNQLQKLRRSAIVVGVAVPSTFPSSVGAASSPAIRGENEIRDY